jgi:hypothetical protein
MQMKKSVSLATVVLGAILSTSVANAANETFRVSVPYSYVSTGRLPISLVSGMVPKFDTSKGTLTRVTVRAYIRATGNVVSESTLTGNSGTWDSVIRITPTFTVSPSGASSSLTAVAPGTWRNLRLANYDGTQDYVGLSAVTTNISASRMNSISYTDAPTLNAFSGVGNHTINVQPVFAREVSWFSSVPPTYDLPFRATVSGTVSIGVVYTYTKF